jgi:signal transduction histidine kinase/DNA-binding response OmpR family regulator/HPt (histidine-containing phosphotransfer) domain-containing protein
VKPRSEHRSYLLWLALGTACMALVMAVMLGLQLTQNRAIRASSELRGDNVTALTFQLEREFLRSREALEAAVNHPGNDHSEELMLRLDILMSRVELLRENPSTEVLKSRPEYMATLPRLEALHNSIDRLVESKGVDQAQLAALAREFSELGPEIQALTIAATSVISERLESQVGTMLYQNDKIVWLIVAQLVLLLLAALALTVRQRRQDEERQALEQLASDLREANLQADQANRSKSQFLANMSHELRTPFNGMLGMLSLLDDTSLNTQQKDYVSTARASASHLLTLLNDILDVSALEAGKMRVSPAPVHLPALLMDVDALMRPLAQEKQLGFTLDIPQDLPQWVLADGTRVKQIVLNLVSNAIKFSQQGTVSLQVLAQALPGPADAGTVQLQFHIRDQGIGMDAETVSRLFQRFAQGDNSTSRRFGGTGLGLEISRNLARLMDGDITVQSQVGVGSVFTLTLPLHPCAAPASEAPETGAARPRRASGSRGLDILVAEDHPVNRKYMEGLLKRLGHQVRFAEDGARAVDEVGRQLPDLVLMDLHMPVMDGLQATRTLRSGQGPAAAVPIVALTADAFAESRDRAHAAGMNGFLSKPVRTDQIETVLTQLFGDRGAAVAPAEPAASTPAPELAPATRPAAPAPAAPKAPRRRFRAGDVASHLNMGMVGEVCIAVSLPGYRSLLDSFLGDETGGFAALYRALAGNETGQLQSLAHAVKGAAASLGLQAIAQAALKIEKEGREFDADQCTQAGNEMQELHQTAHALCHRMGLAGSTPPAPAPAPASVSPRPPALVPA